MSGTTVEDISNLFIAGAKGEIMFQAKEHTTKSRSKLSDPQFAYITKDGERKLPIDDAAHVRNAIARFNQTHFESPEAKKKAWNKILRAAKKFGVEVSEPEKFKEEAYEATRKKDVKYEDVEGDMDDVNALLKREDGKDFKPVTSDEFEKAKKVVHQNHPDLHSTDKKKFHQKVVSRVHKMRKANQDRPNPFRPDTPWNDAKSSDENEAVKQIPDRIKVPGSALDKTNWEDMFKNSPMGKAPDWPTEDLPLGMWKMDKSYNISALVTKGYGDTPNIPAQKVVPNGATSQPPPEKTNDFGKMTKKKHQASPTGYTGDPEQEKLPVSNLDPAIMQQNSKRIADYIISATGKKNILDARNLKAQHGGVNPYAVCTASIGEQHTDKWERCVKQVADQYGIELKEGETEEEFLKRRAK